ncbi:MAG TPA: nucleotide pyrophosphohydrolase [Candidatus Microsaccharimonas sp.]|nr:nucleotide pyrophosphohydrolase [Candidatus Microsaccharimonas sp.]
MTLSEYQKQIDGILQGYEKPYWHPLSQLARMTEEVGEVARILNHKYGDKPKKASEAPDDLTDELGDVLWTLICLANNEGIDLESTIQRSIEKLTVRDADRFEKKAV